METYQVGLIAAALFGLWVLYAVTSWRTKRRDQEEYLPKPKTFLTSKESIPAYYVATVFEAQPQKRVLAHGLTYRGLAEISISSAGIGISRVGEEGFQIPADDVVSIGVAGAALDKAVERDGITLISWRLGDQVLQTQLRFQAQKHRRTALSSLNELVAGR